MPGLYRSELQRKQKFESDIILQQQRMQQQQHSSSANAFTNINFTHHSNLLQIAGNTCNLRHESLFNVDEQFFALDDPIR